MKRIITIIICLLTLCGITTAQDIYAVVVGIPNYQYINSLVLPGKDAKAVAEYYKQKTNYVITLTGKYATKAAVTKSLSDQFSRAKEGDAAVFYFSGHGYEGGLCPYDINANDPNSGLSYSEIQQIFRNCKAKRKIVFADACFSGGLTGKFASSSRNGLEILLFLASRDSETSMELPFMANGVFTTYLLRGLRGNADGNRDGSVTARELFNYVSKGVIYKTNQKQHPVMWGKFDDNMILN
ncbi:MAG: caspase family protein [Bacteroidales bacterium]|nr:caspase family protein [Bacteroidales bacterium]